MNIGNLNFNFQKIKSVNFKGNNTKHTTFARQAEKDTFVKTNTEVNPFCGQISYETYIKAKEAVLKSLQKQPQKESVALVWDNKIIYFAEGAEKKVEVDASIINSLTQNSLGKIIFIHSHPEINGTRNTLPLSLTDFLSLYTNDNFAAFCAINKKGEFSILKKKAGFEPDFEKLFQIQHQFNVALAEAFEGKEKEEYQNFLKDEEKMLKGEDVDISELLKNGKHYSSILESKDCSRLFDLFWREHAKEYGLEYSSNYSF